MSDKEAKDYKLQELETLLKAANRASSTIPLLANLLW